MSLDAQSQELGQTGTLALPHLRRTSGQQMTFPGFSRLGRLQKPEGQEGFFLVKLVLAGVYASSYIAHAQ